MNTKLIKRFFFVLILYPLVQFSVYGQGQERYALNEIRLLESPFLKAEQTDLQYMLQLDPDRLLAPYLREAGLPAKAESYGNWESMGLDGHTAGHYLTALAQMYASTGNKECKTRLDDMISELARCQQNTHDGYVGGVPGGQAMWALFKKGDFSLFYKKWVPWYNLHKLFAGLRDAYLIGGNQQAGTVLVKLADWAYNELSGLTEQQVQSMLNMEQGGMNEVCADVAAITGNSKYLKLAKQFSQQKLLRQLGNKEDNLTGMHANTQIPKVVGFERIAQIDPEDTLYDKAARFFWNTVVKNRTISIGGNSVAEHFNPADDFSSMIESVQGPETCNSYNMLKLTEDLFLSKPDAAYMDYYERTLYNHILSSEREDLGGFVYFTPVRPREYRVYSTPQNDFWCCVGTGMENHGKYGEMIYTRQGNDIYVNLFIASVLDWKEQGVVLTQQNRFPFKSETELSIKLHEPKEFTLYIRQPGWLKGAMVVKVNGKKIPVSKNTIDYVSVRQLWHNGDRVTVELPMKDTLERLPDHSAWASLLHGPVVLAAKTDTTGIVGENGDGGRFDHIAGGPLYDLANAPVLSVNNANDLSKEMIPVKDQPLDYKIPSLIAQPEYKDLTLVPFFQIRDSRYMLYWPVAKPGEVADREKELAAQDKEVLRMSLRTIDDIAPGEQQPEVDHALQSKNSTTGIFENRHWRSAAGGFFSYTLKMDPKAKWLSITCNEEDKANGITVYMNDKKLSPAETVKSKKNKFYSVDFAVPDSLKDSVSVTIRFVAEKEPAPTRIFGIRLMK